MAKTEIAEHNIQHAARVKVMKKENLNWVLKEQNQDNKNMKNISWERKYNSKQRVTMTTAHTLIGQ